MLSAYLSVAVLNLCTFVSLFVSYMGAWLRMRRDCSNGMLLACVLFNSCGLLLSILLIVAIRHKLCCHQFLLGFFFGKGRSHLFSVPSLFYFMHFHSFLITSLYFCLALCLFIGIELTFRSFLDVLSM